MAATGATRADLLNEEGSDVAEEGAADDGAEGGEGGDVAPEAGATTYAGVRLGGFSDFLLKPEIMQAIRDAAFEHPSEVQQETIPFATSGKDLLCQAKSGMGKTAVFVLAVLNQLDDLEISKKTPVSPYAVVLAHCRELAHQIREEFDRFAKYTGAKGRIDMFVGGLPEEKDRDRIKERMPLVVVGTPGRVKALVQPSGSKGYLDLSQTKVFVVDECDKMLEQEDMRAQVQQVFVQTKRDKQVMMFSATMPMELRATCKKFMRNPVEVYIDDGKLILQGLSQYYLKIEEKEKIGKLTEILDKIDFSQAFVFVSQVQRAQVLAEHLRKLQFPAVAIHSRLKTEERLAFYQGCREYKHRVIVSTDLLSRGIDLERVNLVVNFDMTENSEHARASDTYLHRVGRAGRFGTKGVAITFVSSPEDSAALDEVQKRFAVQIKVAPKEIDKSCYVHA